MGGNLIKNNVLIVGGGILGLLTATELAKSGQKVCLVAGQDERASDASLVWLNVISTESKLYAELRVASMQLWHLLKAEDASCPIKTKGAILWDRDLPALETLLAFLVQVGWEAKILDKNEFSSKAPGVTDPPQAALWAPKEAAADPLDMMNWATKTALKNGVDIMPGAATEILTNGDQVVGARLADGGIKNCERIIVAAGLGSSKLLKRFSIDPGLRNAPGMLLRTQPLPKISDAIMASPLMDYWQADDGRVFVATGTHQTMIDDLEGSAQLALANLGRMAPACADASVQSLLMRLRPIPADGLPVIGSVAGVRGLWMGLSHSGMTLAPVIARSICDSVLENDPFHDVGPFSPNRMKV